MVFRRGIVARQLYRAPVDPGEETSGGGDVVVGGEDEAVVVEGDGPSACRCPGAAELAGCEEGVGVVVDDGPRLDPLVRLIGGRGCGDGDTGADGDRGGFSLGAGHGSDSGRTHPPRHPDRRTPPAATEGAGSPTPGPVSARCGGRGWCDGGGWCGWLIGWACECCAR